MSTIAMRLSGFALIAFLVATTAIGPHASSPQREMNPDALYAAREQLERAAQAAEIWSARLKTNPSNFESAWKLARAAYWLGGHANDRQRRQEYERGIEAARQAAALQPERPEGHFWLAANMGAMAESSGLAGLRYRGAVKRELETVLRLDPAFQEGSADRALGRWYDKVPGLFGGSNSKAVEHLQRSLTYDASSAASHFFLGEVYVDMNRRDDARRELERVLEAPLAPGWEPEVREFQQKARTLIERLK